MKMRVGWTTDTISALGWREAIIMLRLFATLLTFAAAGAAAQSESVVFNFKPPTGFVPYGGLLPHGRADFVERSFAGSPGCYYYGRRHYVGAHCGTVVRLLPPDAQHSTWRGKAIYRFQPVPDGSIPFGSPVADKHGNLFLATNFGGTAGMGAVVELSPPASRGTAWTENVIHSFTGGADGARPVDAQFIDDSDNLYVVASSGGTANDGTILELSPPKSGQTGWMPTVRYTFTGQADGGGPNGMLLTDRQGNVYETTLYNSVVKFTRHNGGAWSSQPLYNFAAKGDGSRPVSGVVSDTTGNLYGTTIEGGSLGSGTVYQLSPPAQGGTTWHETVLYSFTGGADGENPYGNILIDSAGNLFAVTYQSFGPNYGTAVRLSPPQAGHKSWTETTLRQFSGAPDGRGPNGLNVDAAGNLLVTASGGGQYGGGVLAQITGSGFVAK